MRVESLRESETPSKANENKEIMTGGMQPQTKIDEKTGKELIEPTIKMIVSDTSQMTFEVYLPKTMVPDDVSENCVVRIRSLVASTK